MYEKYRFLLDILTFVFMVGVVPLFKLIHKIKTNDLRHIDQKLEDIKDTVTRTEEKLDRHLEAHAEGRFGR